MSSVSAVHATANSRINEHDHLSKPARRAQGATSSRVSSLYQTVKVVMISDCLTHCIKAWACSVDAAVWWWSSSSYHMSGWTSVTTALSLYWCVCVPIWCVSYVCEMFVCYMCALCLHEGLQALSDVSLSQWYRPVGFWTLQGSLVLLAAHQTQHGSVQILVLLLWGQSAALTLVQVPLKKPHHTCFCKLGFS